jgi:methyltransferase family protein
MNIPGFVKAQWAGWQRKRAQTRFLKGDGPVADLDRSQWQRSLADPTGFYLDCFRYFHRRLPEQITSHRRYFMSKRRGFGEDAFHTMWFLLFRQFKPTSFLEIGVYRGQTLSLAGLLARREPLACHLCGISPFSSVGDSVSKYNDLTDYYSDTLRNFKAFDLPPPTLVRAYSNDDQAREAIRSRPWEIVYIDGNHDYAVVKADWEICSANLKPGGLIVLDDSGITSAYQPPIFATRGHPGPSRVAAEISPQMFKEILQVGHNRVFQKASTT